MQTLAKALVQVLVDCQTEYFFCVTGGDQDLWLALDEADIRVVNCRSEQAAAYAADGYARISGRPAFVYGQRGPGSANVAAALADPYWAMSPVVSLTSATATTNRSRFDYQDIDQLSLYGPVTKWSQSVLQPEDGPRLLRAAIRAATSAPTGPVHLEVPMDMFGAAVPAEDRRDLDPSRGLRRRPAPAPEEVADVLRHLHGAQRPVLIAGAGVVRSAAFDELRTAAEQLRLPVATTMGGKGAIAEQHELAIGVLGRYSRRSTNEIVADADCALVIGSRLGSMATNGNRLPGPESAVLHVDVDPDALGANYTERVGVLADAGLFLAGLRDLAQREGFTSSWDSWTEQCRERTDAWTSELAAVVGSAQQSPIHPAVVMHVLRQTASAADIVVADTGFAGAWTGALYPQTRAGLGYIRAVGSLGWATAAGLGAGLAAGDRRTIVVTGDGGVGYNIMELETALRHGVNLVVVVLNNLTLAFEYHEQRLRFEKRVVPSVNDYLDVDYAGMAQAMGAYGRRVDRIDDLHSALADAFTSHRPALIDVRIDKEVYAPVTNFESVERRPL